MIDCRIVGLSQNMSFEENTSQLFLVIELPAGQRIQAAVDDDTARKVVALQIQARGVPRAAAPPREAEPEAAAPLAPPPLSYAPADTLEEIETTDGPALVFGGQPDEIPTDDYAAPPAVEDVEEEEEEEEEEDEPPPPPQETPRQAKKRLRRNGSVPSRTVPRNEYGYPIPTGGGPDPEQLVGTANQDEDGVGSI